MLDVEKICDFRQFNFFFKQSHKNFLCKKSLWDGDKAKQGIRCFFKPISKFFSISQTVAKSIIMSDIKRLFCHVRRGRVLFVLPLFAFLFTNSKRNRKDQTRKETWKE